MVERLAFQPSDSFESRDSWQAEICHALTKEWGWLMGGVAIRALLGFSVYFGRTTSRIHRPTIFEHVLGRRTRFAAGGLSDFRYPVKKESAIRDEGTGAVWGNSCRARRMNRFSERHAFPGWTESRPTRRAGNRCKTGSTPNGIDRTSDKGNRRQDSRSASAADSSRGGDAPGSHAAQLCRNGRAGNGSVPRRNPAGREWADCD